MSSIIGGIPSSKKLNKIHLEKIYFTLILKNFLYFLKRKLFLYLGKWTPGQKFLMFQETDISYTSGNGNPKKTSCISQVTFCAQKMKKNTAKMFLIFQEMEKIICALALLLIFPNISVK